MNRTLLIGVVAVSGVAVAEPSHPALSRPDGVSQRGGKLVGHSLRKWEDVVALGKLYRTADGFETRQEYFLRLLDYFWFSEKRLIGMKRAEIESVFGKGAPADTGEKGNAKEVRLGWSGGRDSIQIWFENDIATGAVYVMGY